MKRTNYKDYLNGETMNNNKTRKLKPLTEKEKEIIWRSLSWE